VKLKRSWRLIAVLTMVGVVGAACGGNKDKTTDASSDVSTTMDHSSSSAMSGPNFDTAYADIREAYKHMYDTGDVLTGAIATQKGFAETGNKAADVRITLSRLLGEHALLAAVATTKGLGGAADFGAAGAALDKNSADLGDVIGSVYGDAAKNEFLKQWRDHIRMFVDYTTATAKKDTAARDTAAKELDGYTVNFGKFLGTAVGLPPAAVTSGLKMHVAQLAGAIDAAAAGKYDKAYADVRAAYKHMVETGGTLATAIAKQKNLGDPNTKSATTRATLDSLLGEHAAMAALATTKGFDGAPDFKAVADSLDKNSAELGDVIGSVYGPAAKNAFLKQWRDHIRMFVDYTTATAKKDKAGQDAAVAELGGYITNFGQFLGSATGLPPEAVQASLKMHVTQLKGALDAYAGNAA